MSSEFVRFNGRLKLLHQMALLEHEQRCAGIDPKDGEIEHLKKKLVGQTRLIQLALKDYKETGRVTFYVLQKMASEYGEVLPSPAYTKGAKVA